MVVLSDGGHISVKVGDTETNEYRLEQTAQGRDVRKTCYIEAKEEDQFRVLYHSIAVRPGSVTDLKLFVDGQLVDFLRFGCSDQSNAHGVFKGYTESCTGETVNLRAFTFGKVKTTSEGSPKEIADDKLMEACTIKIVVSRKRRFGEKKHFHRENSHQGVPKASVLHEDSKQAVWGLSAVPGQSFQRTSGGVCYCRTHDDGTSKTDVVIFKYMKRSWLVVDDLMQTNFDQSGTDSEVECDVQRTERSAAKRKARLSWAQSSRVKREATIKSEGGESTRRIQDVIDLTSDDDYVGPSRKVGETIELSDDDEDEDNDIL